MRIIIGILILISSVSFGQNDEFTIFHNKKVVGTNLITGTEIKGTEYIFPKSIYKYHLDTINDFLTVQIRKFKNGHWFANKGNILQYDLKNNNLLWSEKIHYLVWNLKQAGDTMIYTFKNKSSRLDVNTGNKIWTTKNNIYYVLADHNTGLGYRYTSPTVFSNDLEGIDLENGQSIWKREINREYGWNGLLTLNDSTQLVVATGLHTINIHDGKGWDYNTITWEKDYKETVAANAAGIAFGLLTGTFFIATGHNLVHEIVSNALTDSLYIYFASKEQLVKIEKESGEIIWTHPFPKDFPSKSSLFMNDSVVYMVNYGYAIMNNRRVNFGKPFIAAFDKNTGRQKYFSLIVVNRDPILEFKILNNELYLVFKNRMAKYSIETGNQIMEKKFPKRKYTNLKGFIGNRVYITNENEELICLPQSDTAKVFVYTSEDKILTIDNQLDVTNTTDFKDVSINYLHTPNHKFFAKDNRTLITDNEGKRIAEIKATSKAILAGNTLYDKQGRSLVAIDLEGIIGGE